MIIYTIINKINGKMYIGKSVKDDITSSNSRPYDHFNGKRSYSKSVFRDVQLYGTENFVVIILHKANCTAEQLNDIEKWYILHLNVRVPNGYNIVAGGEGGDTFSRKPEEEKAKIRKKLSESNKIAQNRPEVKKKVIDALTNRTVSLATRKKLSEATKLSMSIPEIRKKMIDSKKGLKRSDEIKKKMSIAAKIAMNRTEVKKKLSEAGKGKQPRLGIKHAEESKNKMSIAHKGKKLTLETKTKMSEFQKVYQNLPEVKIIKTSHRIYVCQ